MEDCKIYVGTYAKYNAGSIRGQWLDLHQYDDTDAFWTACRNLHSDEADPEFMFQDFEGFPRAFYSECSLDSRIFEYRDMNRYDQEIWEAYLQINASATWEEAQDAFCGTADSEQDYAEEYAEETGLLESVPEDLRRYFDFEAYARDLFNDGLTFERFHGTGYVFRDN